jgi:hypothetical protein
LDNWTLLNKELSYFGIRLINDGKCQYYIDGKLKNQGIITTIRQLGISVKKHEDLMGELFNKISNLLSQQQNTEICDERLIDLFKISLKELSMFLTCFDDHLNCDISKAVNNALSRDIQSFSKEQIYKLPDYKISIDWTHRFITRLIYIRKLLSYASVGRKHVNKYEIKTARGISGPWSNLDLPMKERCYPFESEELQGISKDKEKQRRYRKGFENYNGDGRVSEGHYWREIRNEPYSWSSRGTDSPYPSRNLLMR